MPTISVVTNASANDAKRLALVVPHWISVLGERLAELVIVLDTAPPSGRIAALHGQTSGHSFEEKLSHVRDLLIDLSAKHHTISVRPVPEDASRRQIIGKWFGDPKLDVNRCQAGTPILPFIAAFEAAKQPIVLRADCDMLFFDAGWINTAIELLATNMFDLVEPPRCGLRSTDQIEVSTRALMLCADMWASKVLPLPPSRLDLARRIHRRLHNRPPWLALEQMLEMARRSKRLRYTILNPDLGSTLHIATQADAALECMNVVSRDFEAGRIPEAQVEHGHNFYKHAWNAAHA